MNPIQTQIGNRFEAILKERYPDLKKIGNPGNRLPDFEHELFYAEAKVAFDQSDYTVHIKERQVHGFDNYDKPVLYLIGFHNFDNPMHRLGRLSEIQIWKELKKMDISKLFIVDNEIIKNIWGKRNYICEKGHIHDCTLKFGTLQQIICNKNTKSKGETIRAREYYNVPEDYSFGLFEEEIMIGHIMPTESDKILDYLYGGNT